jgi:MFS transporter, UMF1 family
MTLLEKLGLHRRELRAWAMYDWGLSGLQTVIMTAVFPIYFVRVAAAGLSGSAATQQLARANAVAMLVVAAGAKKRFLAIFTVLGAAAVGAMFGIGQGDLRLAATLYVVALVGGTGCVVFYESLLPHIAKPEEFDRVSTAGYGLGYMGGGILVALNLAWIQRPDWFGLPEGTLPARLAFVSVGIWWLVFALPLFLRVPEPARVLETDERPQTSSLRMGYQRLTETLRELRGFKHAFLMLLAFMIYNDGIQTIVKMATAYGTEIGIGQGSLIAAIVMVQFVGVPFAFAFGRLAGGIGAKRAILIGLTVYAAISVLGYFMTTATHFFILAGLVGMVQGGTQALSRSLFASMIPPHKSAEFFGFYSVFEKFAGVLGPLFFDLAITLTGSSRNAILFVIVFFITGGFLLTRVNVAEGQRVARERERELTGLT